MKDTAFHVPPEKLGRLPPSYSANPGTGKLELHDDPANSRWAKPPAFASGGGGLVSTVDDYLAFCQMLLDKGRYGRERILSRPSVELMTTDQLTQQQKAAASLFFGDGVGWGFGVSVVTRRTNLFAPGRFGWDGGHRNVRLHRPGGRTHRHPDDAADDGFAESAESVRGLLVFCVSGDRRLTQSLTSAADSSSAT